VVCSLLLFIHFQGSIAAAFVLYALSAPVAWLWRQMLGGNKKIATETENGAIRVVNTQEADN